MDSKTSPKQLDRFQHDFLDALDEELELELEDNERPPGRTDREAAERLSRSRYFRELIRLQAELIKLQDWLVTARRKIVVLFEGRDAAGKGGAIKRITQRLNPRVVRVA